MANSCELGHPKLFLNQVLNPLEFCIFVFTMTKFLLLIILIISIACKAGIGDSTKVKNIIFLHTNYPLPASGVTFKRVFTGVINVSWGYQRLVYKNLYAGVCADYTLFKTSSKALDTKSKMQIISPSLCIGFQFTLLKKIIIFPTLHGGYAFITYKGKDADGNPKPKFNEQGAFIRPSLFVGYLLSENISIGLNGSYRVIFEHFGSNATLEDNTIRMADFGLGISYKL